MKRILMGICILFFLITPAISSEIEGKWVGQYLRQNGQYAEIFWEFKINEGEVSGTFKSAFGEGKFTGGKFKDDLLTFQIDVGGSKVNCEGTLKEGNIRLIEKFADGYQMIIDLTRSEKKEISNE
jgi:hypothetical protein